jgi:hypothetical protein
MKFVANAISYSTINNLFIRLQNVTWITKPKRERGRPSPEIGPTGYPCVTPMRHKQRHSLFLLAIQI